MTFAVTPGTAYADDSGTIDATVLNYWRTAISQSLDGAAGGTYTPSAILYIHGMGADIAPLQSTDVFINSGGTGLTIASGAFLLIEGAAEFTSGSNCSQQSGATWNLSGTTNLYGQMVVEPDGVIDVTGTGGHPGTIEWQNFGVAQFDSGSTLTMQAGSAATQSGTWTKSGDGAWNMVRTTTTTTTTSDLHPEYRDVVVCAGTSYQITLADPNTSGSGGTPLPEGILCRFCHPFNGGGGTAVQITDHSGTTIANLSDGVALRASAFVDVMTVNVSGTISWVVVGGNNVGD